MNKKRFTLLFLFVVFCQIKTSDQSPEEQLYEYARYGNWEYYEQFPYSTLGPLITENKSQLPKQILNKALLIVLDRAINHCNIDYLTEIVTILIENGANPNLIIKQANRLGDKALIQLLIQYGVNPNRFSNRLKLAIQRKKVKLGKWLQSFQLM